MTLQNQQFYDRNINIKKKKLPSPEFMLLTLNSKNTSKPLCCVDTFHGNRGGE